ARSLWRRPRRQARSAGPQQDRRPDPRGARGKGRRTGSRRRPPSDAGLRRLRGRRHRTAPRRLDRGPQGPRRGRPGRNRRDHCGDAGRVGAVTLADPPLAATAIAAADRIVIKIGSSLLVDRKTNAVDLVRLRGLAADIAGFKADGKQVLVVSSGAVALGRRRLGSRARGAGLEKKQAAAAAGQSMLMHAWESVFDPHDIIVAQILLTRDDTETRRRWLNARATVGALLDMGAVP